MPTRTSMSRVAVANTYAWGHQRSLGGRTRVAPFALRRFQNSHYTMDFVDLNLRCEARNLEFDMDERNTSYRDCAPSPLIL